MRGSVLLWCLRVWIFAIALTAHAGTAANEDKPAVRLVLELSDGSRIVGTPAIDRLKITTQYADLELPLSAMRILEFKGGDGSAQASLRNGDLVSGKLADTEIAMKTSFGQVVIPLALVKRIRVEHAGGGESLPEGCVLHYTFDTDEEGTVTDVSSNGNDGTVQGATYANKGNTGGAMSFNGDRAAVITKNATSLQLQDFTIMAWIKRADKDKASLTGVGGGGMIVSYGQGGYGLGFGPDHVALTKVGVNEVSSNLELLGDTGWHHIAVTKSGNKIIFYLDGIAHPAGDYDTQFEFNTDIATGARGDTLANTFLGLIREVAVFKRALSDDEVKGVYESQK